MSAKRILVGALPWLVALAGCEARPGAPRTSAPQVSPRAGEAGRCAHGLPPTLCTKCIPALAPVFKAKGDWCPEHGFPESFCPICRPDAPVPEVEAAPAPPREGLEARTVQLRSADVERAAGIETALAERGRASTGVECTARLAFDSDRVADVRAIVPGIVRRIHAELGAQVKVGEPLFELESTRVGEIQGALQTAREQVRTATANLDRQRELRAKDIASARQVEIAEQELASAVAQARTAEATLKMAGAARSTPSGRYTLSAPLAGTVVRRPAVLGLLATERESLATVVDTSVMWALCDVPEAHAARVRLGQRVVVHLTGSDEAPLEGEVTWLAAEVDPRTRTVTARAELPNARGQLRANQFARARIETAAPRAAVTVPRGAVQRVEGREVVFVRAAPGVYEPREVRRHGDGSDAERVLIEGRVEPGDAVVTTGAVLLRTEIMPGSIGAGCCEPTGGE